MQRPALYYPYVHIRDEEWLKTAALYWPSVYRMVPAGYFRRDSPTAAEFHREEVLREVDPWDFTLTVESQLARALSDNGAALAKRFSVRHALHDFDGVPFGDVGPEQPALGWIHIKKFPSGLLEQLNEMGLAWYGRAPVPGGLRHRGHEWIGLHPALAGAYMTVLARRISEEVGYDPLTDQPDLRRATVGGDVATAVRLLGVDDTSAVARRQDSDGVQTYVTLALNYVRPENLANVSAEEILRCRLDLADELQAFRDHVKAQQEELASIAAVEHERPRLEAFAEHVRQTIETPLKKLEHGLALHRMEPTRSLLFTGAFTPPAAVATLTDSVPITATTTGVVAAVGSAWWATTAARRSIKEASPVAYLLDVRSRLTPRTISSQLSKLYRGYT